MVYTFFFSKIDFDTYLSFEHFLNHLCTVTVPVNIEISIAETGGDLTLAKKIHYRLKNDPGLQKHTIKTKIYTATTAGLIIALSANFKHRRMWFFGQLQYQLFKPKKYQGKNNIFNNLFMIDDDITDFLQTLNLIHNNTKLDYKLIDSYNNKTFIAEDFTVKEIIHDTFVEESMPVLKIIALSIIEKNSIPYSFPKPLMETVEKILKDYKSGKLDKKNVIEILMVLL